jgi:hypothetical protein
MSKKPLQVVTAGLGLIPVVTGAVAMLGVDDPLYASIGLPRSALLDSNLRFFAERPELADRLTDRRLARARAAPLQGRVILALRRFRAVLLGLRHIRRRVQGAPTRVPRLR